MEKSYVGHAGRTARGRLAQGLDRNPTRVSVSLLVNYSYALPEKMFLFEQERSGGRPSGAK